MEHVTIGTEAKVRQHKQNRARWDELLLQHRVIWRARFRRRHSLAVAAVPSPSPPPPLQLCRYLALKTCYAPAAACDAALQSSSALIAVSCCCGSEQFVRAYVITPAGARVRKKLPRTVGETAEASRLLISLVSMRDSVRLPKQRPAGCRHLTSAQDTFTYAHLTVE